MPRRPSGVFIPPTSKAALRRGGLYRRLRDGIVDGTFAAGAQLPSGRALASELGLSRTTVEAVYEQLASEGLIERTGGRGSFVASLPGVVSRPGETTEPRISLSHRGRELGAETRTHEPTVLRPFNAGVPDTTLFPFPHWERCRRRALAEPAMLLNHSDTGGLHQLREALARHLTQTRGVRAEPEQILIFESTAQALLCLFLLLADPADPVLIEDPGYPGAFSSARLAGLDAIPAPVDADGIDIAAATAKAPGARLAYVTPAHQFPTGAYLTPSRRGALLTWARELGRTIIEDDYDADFRHSGEPLTTLYSQDGGEHVVYIGTLSKAMFLGLRVAYAVMPMKFIEAALNVKSQLHGFPPLETQATLARFIEEGRLATHLRHARRAYADKQRELLDELRPMIERGWRCGPTSAGLHFMLYEPAPNEARRVAVTSELALTTLSNYARTPLQVDGLSIRFGGLSLETIRSGARALCALG